VAQASAPSAVMHAREEERDEKIENERRWRKS
jgi:hypothetical protein